MKTRLLKKVRKRYSITRIDNVSSNDSHMLKIKAKHFGLPFYCILDNYSRVYNIFTASYRRFKYIKTYKDSISFLQDMIFKEYKKEVKHKKMIETKVWYVD